MKCSFLTLAVAFLVSIAATVQAQKADIVTTDIDNFWHAYDKIVTTTDSVQQYDYLNQLFLSKGTPGLKAIMQVRHYTAKEYVDAINRYPLFWKSIRPNMGKAKGMAADIGKGVRQLKKLYPELKPAKIYFTVGAFRTGGTILDSMVLIGSEIALADSKTITSEFPAPLSNLGVHFKTDPVNSQVFNNIHEYVHTQQKSSSGNSLLAQTVMEGVAEWTAEKTTGQASPLPAIRYGLAHANQIKEVFARQMFNQGLGFWISSNEPNRFNMRDLGYYVGYAMCQKYYAKAVNKQKAVREMIELDYNNETALESFVDTSGYFDKSVADLRVKYDASRPYVTSVTPLNAEGTLVSPAITKIVINFSEPINRYYRNFEIGPLGEGNLMRLKRFIGYGDDSRSATFEVELKPNQRYQLMVGEGFRNTDGIRLKPYLIDFTTGGK